MRRLKVTTLIALALLGGGATLNSQVVTTTQTTTHDTPFPKVRRAWEVGLGGVLTNWNRVSITGFNSTPEQYLYSLRIDHLMGGAQLYLAHELNPWFYLDMQANASFTKNRATNKHNMLLMGGLGVQFRFSPLFKSQYVEPYLRIGANYLYKDFSSITRAGFEGDPTGQAGWESSDVWNPNGNASEKNSFFPLSFGAGVNAWLNNSLGLGLQGEFLMPIRPELPRFAQVSLRVMVRFGGKSKKPDPIVRIETIEIVEKPVERVVEKFVEQEVAVDCDTTIFALLSDVTFKFDSYQLTEASKEELDKAAIILLKHTDKHFLITGFTDARGSEDYNLTLSEKRAETVKKALIERGVPQTMLKSRGVGKAIAAMPTSETHSIRQGDRKVTIELITNLGYWKQLR